MNYTIDISISLHSLIVRIVRGVLRVWIFSSFKGSGYSIIDRIKYSKDTVEDLLP